MKCSIEKAISSGAEFKAFDEEAGVWRESWDFSENGENGYTIYHSGPEGFTVNKGAFVIVDENDID